MIYAAVCYNLYYCKLQSQGAKGVSRLKHCNLSTIPKKGAQNQAP